MLVGVGRRRRARRDAELGEDVAHVASYGPLAEEQLGGDGAVRLARRDEAEDFHLTWRQPPCRLVGRRAGQLLDPGEIWRGLRGARTTARAAYSSISAVSMSPRARYDSPMWTRTHATSYGTSSSCNRVHARRSGSSAAAASPSASRTAPLASSDSATRSGAPNSAAMRASSSAAVSAACRLLPASAISTDAPSSLLRLTRSSASLSRLPDHGRGAIDLAFA